MKMKRRQNLRESKAEAKGVIKMKKMLSAKIQDQQEDIIKAIQDSISKKDEEKQEESKAISEVPENKKSKKQPEV